jgi:hypothetical protein
VFFLDSPLKRTSQDVAAEGSEEVISLHFENPGLLVIRQCRHSHNVLPNYLGLTISSIVEYVQALGEH